LAPPDFFMEHGQQACLISAAGCRHCPAINSLMEFACTVTAAHVIQTIFTPEYAIIEKKLDRSLSFSRKIFITIGNNM
jgi:hypothetical protein